MRFRLDREAQVTRDLEHIYDLLFESYVGFGDTPEVADIAAAERVSGIEDAMEALGDVPHQGTLYPQLMPALRGVTKDRAIFYFVVDDEAEVVRVLAVFFGGQEHQREMLKRVMQGR